jgi:hypothetical protein
MTALKEKTKEDNALWDACALYEEIKEDRKFLRSLLRLVIICCFLSLTFGLALITAAYLIGKL